LTFQILFSIKIKLDFEGYISLLCAKELFSIWECKSKNLFSLSKFFSQKT